MAFKISILYTARLCLKTLKNIDAGKLYILAKENRERLREDFPITTKNTATFEKTENFVNELIKGEREKLFFVYGLWLRKELIGCISILKIDWSMPKCELAYYIDQKYEGMGFISESLKQVCRFCFNNLGMVKICIRTNKKNSKSQHAALSAGFLQEGVLRDEFRTGDSKIVDIIYFELTQKRFNKIHKGI